jgi:hypothetical protein
MPVSKRIANITAIFIAMAVAWAVSPRTDALAALNEQPPSDVGVKPFDRSCYVRDEDGVVRYYLEGPLRDGELPFLQGQPVIGADGRMVMRDDVPQSAIPPRILRALPCPPGKHHLS